MTSTALATEHRQNTPAAAVRTEFVQGTPGWVDARRDLITASELPILTGNTPYGTSLFSLWAMKTRLAEPEPIDPDTQELFDLGHALEDDIAERYTIKTGRPLRRANRLLIHPTTPWLGASLDRVSAVKGEKRVVELKWVPFRRWSDDGPEPVPAYVQDQVQAQLLVTGFEAADVAVFRGSKVFIYEILPDAAYQANLLTIARWFRRLIELGTPPPIDGSEATRRALAQLYPRPQLDMLEPNETSDKLLDDLRVARLLSKSATTRQTELENELRALIGDHEGVTDEAAYKATWLKNKDGIAIDWQAIATNQRRLITSVADAVAFGEDKEGRRVEELVGEDGALALGTLLDSIETLHTTTVPGPRVLRIKYRDEETGRWV